METVESSRFLWVNQNTLSKKACFGQIIYQPGGSCGPRIQPDYQLVILHTGGCEVSVDDERRTLSLDSVALFLPGHREHFQFSPERETHHSWCAVSPGGMPQALARELAKAPFHVPPSEVFHRLLATGLLMGTPHNPGSERVITQLAVLLFAEFLSLADAQRPKRHAIEPLKRALGHMEDHLGEDHCLAGALACSRISRNALIQHFTRELGLSPSRYLWRLRTERGISMLAKTGLTISEIAYQCGFKNPFHFSRMVRQQQGISPREVRKQAWRVLPE